MNRKVIILLSLLIVPIAARADVGKVVGSLHCGIYDQQVVPFVEQELETQHVDRKHYTLEMTTKSGKRLSAEVKNVSIKMAGERNQVTVLVDGKPFAKTSHQDVPLSVEVYIDDVKYRIICVRQDPLPEDVPTAQPKEQNKPGQAR
jgi:hypothetical protein